MMPCKWDFATESGLDAVEISAFLVDLDVQSLN